MKNPIIIILITLVLLTGCTTVQIKKGSWARNAKSGSDSTSSTAMSRTTTATTTYSAPRHSMPDTTIDSVAAIGKRYARLNTPGGRVLKKADALVYSKELILGSCGDFVNAVYERAGYPAEKREKLYSEKETGPFADPGLLLPGDWVMYRNLPYAEIGHSAIFIEWIDFEKRSALTIEYVGGNRKVPGRYREADLTKIWGIVRGKDN